MAGNDSRWRKREALDFFTQKLLTSEVKDSIAKIILFGSFLKGKTKADSDIDLFIAALDNLNAVSDICAELSLEALFKYGERIEPLVGSIKDLRRNDSYFTRRVLKGGKEIFSMKEEALRKGEAGNSLNLAVEYLNQSRANLELGNFRLIVDGAYNAAELCAKGLLLLKGEEIPKRHGSIVKRLSEAYIKTGELPREIGRAFNRSLEIRSKARYEYHAAITEHEAKEMLKLAEEFVKALEDRL